MPPGDSNNPRTALELTDEEADRFVLQAIARARWGITDEALTRAVDELMNVKFQATLWRLWEQGEAQIGVNEDGELRWYATDVSD